MRYLCWDIDGTLLLTNNAGLDALNLTIRERLGQDYHFTHPLRWGPPIQPSSKKWSRPWKGTLFQR